MSKFIDAIVVRLALFAFLLASAFMALIGPRSVSYTTKSILEEYLRSR